MQIQHIDMSVPVSGDAPEREENTSGKASSESPRQLSNGALTGPTSEQSRTNVDLDALAQALVRAVRQRSGLAWTERGRILKREQSSREIKGIIKRLASASAAVVKDRSCRREVRIRIYADALAMVSALTTAQDLQQARSRTVRRWCWRIASVFAASAAWSVALLYGGVSELP